MRGWVGTGGFTGKGTYVPAQESGLAIFPRSSASNTSWVLGMEGGRGKERDLGITDDWLGMQQ